MSRFAILALRTLIVVIILGMLVGQVLIIPAIARDLGGLLDSEAATVWYIVIGVALAACAQLVLVAIWMLLSMVRRGAIFSDRAFRWVDVIIGAGVGATALAAAGAVHTYLVLEPPLDAPGLVVMAGGGFLCTAAFVLVVVVMRGLLTRATMLQSELEEVV